jgi:hypothetical protein
MKLYLWWGFAREEEEVDEKYLKTTFAFFIRKDLFQGLLVSY